MRRSTPGHSRPGRDSSQPSYGRLAPQAALGQIEIQLPLYPSNPIIIDHLYDLPSGRECRISRASPNRAKGGAVSVLKIIGASLLVLLAVYGLIATLLMLLNRIKEVFNASIPLGPTHHRNTIGLRAIVNKAKARPRRFLLVLVSVCVVAIFPQYVLFGLFALGVIAAVYSVIAKWRGWGSEGRLERHLSRPPLVEESHRTASDSASSFGRHIG